MKSIAFNPIYLNQNMGHGNARRIALEHCRNELVALMDADDISKPNRFAIQISNFIENPNLSVCGGQITEFIDSPTNIIDKREVPAEHDDIKEFMKHRCPMNQVSVMFKKKDVQKCGGYKDWYCNEDYYLWIRMLLHGFVFENTKETLVNVRIGNDMASRRGGFKYFKSEAKLQSYMLSQKIITPFQWIYNVGIRFGGEVILNNHLRQMVLPLLRSKADLEKTNTEITKIDKGKDIVMDENSTPPFSVAMCVYGKDNPEWFDTALYSVINQTVQPNEIVLVVDGPIPESLQKVIDKYANICPGGVVTKILLTHFISFRVIYFKENRGLGKGLEKAVEMCRNEIIARMDSDDIAESNRFEMQIRYLINHPETDIIGGQIAEFIDSTDNIVGKRIVPLTDSGCKEYMKKRCPFNHMTVMFKRSSVMASGNYREWFWNEDYYLWIRMALNNCNFANLPETLVKVRVGEDMYSRRGGINYFVSEEKIQRLMLNNKVTTFSRYIVNTGERFILQVLMPNKVRAWVFKTFARN